MFCQFQCAVFPWNSTKKNFSSQLCLTLQRSFLPGCRRNNLKKKPIINCLVYFSTSSVFDEIKGLKNASGHFQTLRTEFVRFVFLQSVL